MPYCPPRDLVWVNVSLALLGSMERLDQSRDRAMFHLKPLHAIPLLVTVFWEHSLAWSWRITLPISSLRSMSHFRLAKVTSEGLQTSMYQQLAVMVSRPIMLHSATHHFRASLYLEAQWISLAFQLLLHTECHSYLPHSLPMLYCTCYTCRPFDKSYYISSTSISFRIIRPNSLDQPPY